MIFLKGLKKKIRRQWYCVREDTGAVAIIFALTLLPMISLLGLAVDVGRAYYINSVVTGAVDAAALAGARAGGSTGNMSQQATALFYANIPSDFQATMSVPNIQFSSNNQVITVSAAGTIDTTLFQIFGVATLTTTASAQAQVSTQGAEVVLALDNTGSMSGGPMSDEITAARTLVNTLYGGASVDTVSGLWVGVVPYTTTVNINMPGSPAAGSNWLTPVGQLQIANTASLYPNIAPTSTSVGGRWMGCIEARIPKPASMTTTQYTNFGYTNYAAGLDFLDTPPTSATTKFTPFLYPSTMAHKYAFGQPLNRGTTSSSTTSRATSTSPPWGRTGATRGDNDWALNGTVPSGSNLRFGDNYAWGGDGNYGVGPNLGCPIPMLPLTASQTTVQNTISNMKATFRGGTMISVGLNAAWWMLSPSWRGLWPGSPSTLPQDYVLSDGTQPLKVIVLMTDGQNEWYDWPIGVPGQPDTSHNYAADKDYTGYGRLAEGRAGTTDPNGAGTQLNTNMANMCTTIKNKGIVIYSLIYTHGRAIDQATQTLFQNCATAPADEHYFFAASNADLQAAFSSIGQSITNLRLTWPGQP
ncbi:MAG: VWA domain-containing protein [Proteobacteria bacterium]|nr:VWA domain-containing protein [Pseudomonadota bacterium]